MSKKIFLPAVFAIAILTVGFLATSNISAQDSYPPIIERLAERFNLNKDEVRDVFDDVRDERRADMYANFVERLDDLVAEGKLTAEQKDALLAKHEEMQSKIDALSNANPSERRDQMRNIHDDFADWAQSQRIDLSVIRPFGAGPRHDGQMPGMWMGMHN